LFADDDRYDFFNRQYFAGHELFLDGNSAVFVVVMRLDQPWEESARQLWYWLQFIKGRMREQPEQDSRPLVLVVGSRRDAAGADVTLQDSTEWRSKWGTAQLQSVRGLCLCVCYQCAQLSAREFLMCSCKGANSANGLPLTRTST
jgi:hypothetical protein